MKKNLFIVLAVAGALASCSNDETLQVVQHQPQAIGFSSYVDKATRADVDLNALKESDNGFNVWGEVSSTSTGTAHLFEGELVTWDSSNSKWIYTNTRYWQPSTNYAFTAIGPKDASGVTYAESTGSSFTDNLHGTITMNNGATGGNCMEDVVYDMQTRTTNATLTAGTDDKVIDFTFNHILSKVQVKFTNGFTVTGQNIKVSNVKVCSLPTGTLNLNNHSTSAAVSDYVWTPSGDLYAKACTPNILNSGNTIAIGGNASVAPIYIIPNQTTLYIEFDVQMYSDTQAGNTYSHTGTSNRATATITGGLKPGTSYILTAEINAGNIDPNGSLKSITFNVTTVNTWTSGGDVNVTFNSY